MQQDLALEPEGPQLVKSSKSQEAGSSHVHADAGQYPGLPLLLPQPSSSRSNPTPGTSWISSTVRQAADEQEEQAVAEAEQTALAQALGGQGVPWSSALQGSQLMSSSGGVGERGANVGSRYAWILSLKEVSRVVQGVLRGAELPESLDAVIFGLLQHVEQERSRQIQT